MPPGDLAQGHRVAAKEAFGRCYGFSLFFPASVREGRGFFFSGQRGDRVTAAATSGARPYHNIMWSWTLASYKGRCAHVDEVRCVRLFTEGGRKGTRGGGKTVSWGKLGEGSHHPRSRHGDADTAHPTVTCSSSSAVMVTSSSIEFLGIVRRVSVGEPEPSSHGDTLLLALTTETVCRKAKSKKGTRFVGALLPLCRCCVRARASRRH